MDHFIFRTMLAGTDETTEMLTMPRVLGVWGSDGANLIEEIPGESQIDGAPEIFLAETGSLGPASATDGGPLPDLLF